MPIYRLATDCPLCQAPLTLRRNRRTRDLFLGCSEYPHCVFTEPYAAAIQHLAMTQHTPTTKVLSRQAMAQELRRLIAIAHPDRWQNHHLSHEITSELVSLREKVMTKEP